MSRRSGVEGSIIKSGIIKSDSSGSGRFKWLVYIIPLIIIGIIGFFVISNLQKIQKRIPQKDPYNLGTTQKDRNDLYQKLAGGENDPDLFSNLAQVAFLQGEIPEAEYFISKCSPSSKNVISLRTKINAFKNARHELENYLYEKSHYFDGDFSFTGAYAPLDRIINLTDEGYIHVRHLFLKGYLLLREGRRSEARIIFEDLKLHGGVLADTSLYMYGKTFMEDTDKSGGVDPLKEYIQRNPESRLAPLAAVNLAVIYESLNQTPEAIKILDSALAKNPRSEYMPELLIEKVNCLQITSKDAGDEILIDLFDRFPSNKAAFDMAVRISDQWEAGSILLSKTKLLLSASAVLIENGRYIQSKKILDALKPTLKGERLAYALFLCAKRNYGSGDKDSGLTACEMAVKAGPGADLKSRIYALMGDIYGAKRDVVSAEKYYLKAADSNGAMSDLALREIARIAYDNGWRDKAWNYYKKLNDTYPNSPFDSESLNYLLVMAFYKGDSTSAGEYASKLAQKGTNFEDRLKGEYYLQRLKISNDEYFKKYPLAYFSFRLERVEPQMYLPPEKSYPEVDKFKSNLGWEYFLAGCYDLAEREYQFINDKQDPYAKMILSYMGYFHMQFKDGIILTRDFTDGNYQSQIEKGYAKWFYDKAFPMEHLDTIEKLAPQNNFPVSLILAIIRQESFFYDDVVSSAGAIGLMQIMPSTGKFVADNNGVGRSFTKEKLNNPELNIKYGIWYLDYIRSSVGDNTGMILASHNAGPGNLKRWEEMFPVYNSDPVLFFELIPARQTRNFVRHVLVNQRIYEKLYKMKGEEVYF